MAKRANTTQKLTAAAQLSTPAPKRPQDSPGMQKKSYVLTPEIVRRVAEQAEAHGVGVGEMARYLLTFAMDQIDSGVHEIPVEVEVVEKRSLGV